MLKFKSVRRFSPGIQECRSLDGFLKDCLLRSLSSPFLGSRIILTAKGAKGAKERIEDDAFAILALFAVRSKKRATKSPQA